MSIEEEDLVEVDEEEEEAEEEAEEDEEDEEDKELHEFDQVADDSSSSEDMLVSAKERIIGPDGLVDGRRQSAQFDETKYSRMSEELLISDNNHDDDETSNDSVPFKSDQKLSFDRYFFC